MNQTLSEDSFKPFGRWKVLFKTIKENVILTETVTKLYVNLRHSFHYNPLYYTWTFIFVYFRDSAKILKNCSSKILKADTDLWCANLHLLHRMQEMWHTYINYGNCRAAHLLHKNNKDRGVFITASAVWRSVAKVLDFIYKLIFIKYVYYQKKKIEIRRLKLV